MQLEGSSTVAACNIIYAAQYPVNCELTSISSFFVAAEAETVVFGVIEIVCCILWFLFVLFILCWPLLSNYIINQIPYSVTALMNSINWLTIRDHEEEYRLNNSISIVCYYQRYFLLCRIELNAIAIFGDKMYM